MLLQILHELRLIVTNLYKDATLLVTKFARFKSSNKCGQSILHHNNTVPSFVFYGSCKSREQPL